MTGPRSPREIRTELLVMRAQDGDGQAFEELSRTWYPALWRYAFAATRDREIASDIVQEAFLAIVRGIGSLNDPAQFRRWAYAITRRKLADQLRGRARRTRLREAHAGEPAPEPDAGPEERQALHEAFERLAPERRELLTLRYAHDLSTDEIAGVLDVPAGTVKSRLHHARAALRRVLSGDDHE